MAMVAEWAAATVVAEMARAATAAAMELVVRVAAAQAGATGRVRTGKAAAAAKDQEMLETVMVAGGWVADWVVVVRAAAARAAAARAAATAGATVAAG